MKQLMLGNEAVARGLYEAGVGFISSYPGTPSTEITECAAKYDEMYCEWAPNEKVAAEAAYGASIAGARSFCAMKHVGLNVAADLLFTASYSGVSGGFVLAVADDQGMHSSQNEQDSRNYAIASKVPMLEPADSAECLSYIKEAYNLSETFDTPVILRLSTRISHSQSIVETAKRMERTLPEYKKNDKKFVMMPSNAKARHTVVENRMEMLAGYAECCSLNTMELNDLKIGIIASGIAYQYAREALGEKASYLKLGMVNPMPVKLIEDFSQIVEKVYVIEELDDVIETHCRKYGIEVLGKDLFSRIGEYSAQGIRKVILGEETEKFAPDNTIPVRPPVLCPGCPHRGIFYMLSKMKLTVSGDIGCYTLAANPPLSAIDTTVCMGASVSGLHGMNTARGKEFAKKSVAVIGDSTFMHSGITGLCNIVYNKGISTVIILDNSITGMTGHQQNPLTGFTIKGEPAGHIDLETLVRGCGVNRVRVVDPFDLPETEKILKEELAAEEPSVIITRRPCVLLKYVKTKPAYSIKQDKCTGCKMCMKIGCPAISFSEGKAKINTALCVGCGLCEKMCKFSAIKEGK